jgi:hypothetical protein
VEFLIELKGAGSAAAGIGARPGISRRIRGRLNPIASRGIALISTLAVVAIVTVLLVSFVSVVNQDRGATQNYGQALKADQIARGGLDTLVGYLRQEATDPTLNDYFSVTAGQTNMYSSMNASNMVPQKWGANAIPILVSYSGNNIYTNGSTAISLPAAASVTISNSLNGRSIPASRWLKPQLVEYAVTNEFPIPSWILVTRNGAAAATVQAATNSATTNGSYVIGRYAYVVYDTSGLIDVTVAGNPFSPGITPKGLLPWADLVQLDPDGIADADVGGLLAWRNAATQGANAATNSPYAAYITNTWATNGFMTVVNGDSTFLGRQDLINYLNSQKNGLSNALPYLTTFSRELNGPTWGPTTNGTMTTTNYQYLTSRTASNNFSNPLAFKAAVTNASSWSTAGSVRQYYPSMAPTNGEPVLKYRFPLNRLALLEQQKAGSSANAELLARYFGIDIAPDSLGLYRHWIYPTTNAKYKHNTNYILNDNDHVGAAVHIFSLDEVAAAGREPDFFELLKAGILSGSLGMVGRGDGIAAPTYSTPQAPRTDPDAMPDLQVIQIGANIMDQWDADNYPTTITYPGPQGIDTYGVENLPYIAQIYVGLKKTSPTNPQLTVPSAWMYFSLWNPHQPPAAAAAANPYPPLKIGILANTNADGNVGAGGPAYGLVYGMPSTGLSAAVNNDMWIPLQCSCAATPGFQSVNNNSNPHTNGIAFNYSPDQYRTNTVFSGGTVVSSESSSTVWTNVSPVSQNPAAISMQGFAMQPKLYPAGVGNPTGAPPGGSTNTGGATDGILTGITQTPWYTNTTQVLNGAQKNWTLYLALANFAPAMYFRDPNNPALYHPYGSYCGVVSNGSVTWGMTYPQPGGYTMSPGVTGRFPYLELTNAMNPAGDYSLVKSDPRTRRWGGAWSLGPHAGVALPSMDLYQSSQRGSQRSLKDPLFGATEGVSFDHTQWATNALGKPFTYQDPDGITRPGDSAAGGSPYAITQNSPGDGRPVVLNRPFTSVGELGYVFRDMPWKTLDFSSGQSADAGLLDYFTLEESPVEAGRVSPNTPYPEVLAALLTGAARNVSANSPAAIDPVVTQLTQDIAAVTGNAPAITRADLTRVMTNSAVMADMAGWPKTEREAVIRSLAESANTRTWNFMIDIIAQSGKYPPTAKNPDNFVVTGERRYWLHVAIDRYTGQVVDQQLEKVGE